MSRPVLQPVTDRLSFGPSTPTIQDQVVLVPSNTGQFLYVGTSSLLTLDPQYEILSINPAASRFTFDLLNSRVGVNISTPTTSLDVNGTVKATTFQGGNYIGNGASLTGIPFSNLTGRIAPTQFPFNSIPLNALSQFGTYTMASGRIVITSGDITSPLANLANIQATNIITTNLTVNQNFSFCNLIGNEITGTLLQAPTLRASNAFITTCQFFSVSNDNQQARVIQAVNISSQNLYGNTVNALTVNLYDATVQSYLPITAELRRAKFNGNNLLDSSDLAEIINQIGGITNIFIAYSTLNTQIFQTSNLQAVAQSVSTSMLSTIQSSRITTQELQAQTIGVNAIGASSFTISSIIGARTILQYIQADQADFPSLSSTRATIQEASVSNLQATQTQIHTLSTGTASLGSYSGTLNDAMTSQVQIYTTTLTAIQPTTTFVDVRATGITVRVPSSSLRTGRILIVKDTQGIVSSSSPLTIQTTNPDTIDGFGAQIVLQQPYAYLILEASPSGKWSIVSGNQFDSLTATRSITLSNATFQMSTIAATPLLLQTVANTTNVVGQRTPLLTRVLTLTSSLVLSNTDLSTYFFLTNPSPSTVQTVFLPLSNSLVNGWNAMIHFNSNSANYISVQDSDTGQFKFLLDVAQSRQIVYTNGSFYSVGGLPPFGIF